MGGKSSPKAPSAAEQAKAQTATNKETALWNAQLNNVNQVTPWGNLTYTQTGGGPQYNMDAYNKALETWNKNPGPANPYKPGTPSYNNWAKTNQGNTSAIPQLKDFMTSSGDAPQYTATVNLSPEQQAILNAQQKGDLEMAQLGNDQIGRIRDSVSTPFSFNGLPSVYGSNEMANFENNGQNALMDRLNPQFARDEEALRSRLINQGIGQGSEAYNREMESFNQKVNDARTQAILGGQQYATNMLNNSMNVRNQAINEYTTQRNAPLNEYIGLTSGVQVQNPNFVSNPGNSGAQAFDVAGAMRDQYSNQQAAANNRNSSMSSLFGLGGSMIGGPVGGFLGSAVGGLFSDRRLKENIIPVGEENGFPIYKFNYINIPDKTYIGVMAQDVESIMPEAVTESEGYKKVDYDMIGLRMMEAA